MYYLVVTTLKETSWISHRTAIDRDFTVFGIISGNQISLEFSRGVSHLEVSVVISHSEVFSGIKLIGSTKYSVGISYSEVIWKFLFSGNQRFGNYLEVISGNQLFGSLQWNQSSEVLCEKQSHGIFGRQEEEVSSSAQNQEPPIYNDIPPHIYIL